MLEKIKEIIQGTFRCNREIWWIYIFFSFVSVLIIYSTAAEDVNPLKTVATHALYLTIGFMCMLTCSSIPYKIWQNLIPLGYFIVLGLIIWAIISSETKRQLFIFQPLEFGKVATVLMIGFWVHRYQKQNIDINRRYLLLLLWVGIMAGTVMVASNSSAIIIGMVSVIILWIAKIKWWRILLTIMGGVLLIAMLVGAEMTLSALEKQYPGSYITKAHNITKKMRLNTLRNRVTNHIKKSPYNARPNVHIHQLEQEELAVYAAASSGIFWGTGPGNSVYKNLFVKGKNDLAFSIIVEEYGILFASVIIFVYLFLLFRIGIILRRTTDTFGSIVIIGFAILISFQAFLHMLVNTGVVPNTGQNLPLISVGGSSVVSVGVMLGIILNIAKSTEPHHQTSMDSDFTNHKSELFNE